MKTDTTLSRRRLLAGVPAVAAAEVPSVATALGGLATGDDPVFAAIEAHREAMRAAASAYIAQGDKEDDSPEWIAAGEAGDRHTDALFDFVTTPPVTMAGVLAALDYAASPMFPDQNGANNKQTVQLDGSTSMDGELIEASAQYPALIAAALRKLLAA